jgi:hypothetical protein
MSHNHEVLGPVIVADSVDVVDIFAWEYSPAIRDCYHSSGSRSGVVVIGDQYGRTEVHSLWPHLPGPQPPEAKVLRP